MLPYNICTPIFINKKCTRTHYSNVNFITICILTILCAHYDTLDDHNTPTTIPNQKHFLNHHISQPLNTNTLLSFKTLKNPNNYHYRTHKHTPHPPPTPHHTHNHHITTIIIITLLTITSITLITYDDPPLKHETKPTRAYKRQQQHHIQQPHHSYQYNHKIPTTFSHYNNINNIHLAYTWTLVIQVLYIILLHINKGYTTISTMAIVGERRPTHKNTNKNTPLIRHTYILLIITLIMSIYAHNNYLTPQHTNHTIIINTKYTLHKSSTTSSYYNYAHTYDTIIYTQQKITQKPPPTYILINNLNNIGSFYYITHIHLKTPKIKII